MTSSIYVKETTVMWLAYNMDANGKDREFRRYQEDEIAILKTDRNSGPIMEWKSYFYSIIMDLQRKLSVTVEEVYYKDNVQNEKPGWMNVVLRFEGWMPISKLVDLP